MREVAVCSSQQTGTACSPSMEGQPMRLSGKEPTSHCRRLRFDHWVRKIPWRRRWQPTPLFLPGKSQRKRTEQRSLVEQFIGLQKPGWLSNSVQFSSSVVSDSLQPHGLQHARLPCPSPIPELVQTHVHGVGDAIQPSYPLSSPPPPAFNLAQYQGLFQWVNTSHQVARVLEFHLQHQSFQWIFRTGFF